MDYLELFEKPPHSDIVERASPAGLIFEVPAQGTFRRCKPVLFFGGCWCAFMAIFTPLSVTSKGGLLDMPLGQAIGCAAFLLMFWLIGVGIIVLAFHLGRRHVTIECTSEQLSLLYSGGPFGPCEEHWHRNELQSLEVAMGGVRNGQVVKDLQIKFRDGRTKSRVLGRDSAELDWLTACLNHSLQLVPQVLHGALVADVDQPPPNCSVLYQPIESGFRLSVPPAGLWRGSLRVFPIGIGWIIWVPTLTALAWFFSDIADTPGPFLAGFLFAIFGNFLLGIGLLVLGYYLGTRRAEIAVAADRLLIIHQGIFANWRREWSRDELIAVRSARSGSSSNNQPFMQLQIVPRHGNPVKLLTGRNDQELAWIATKIRQSLNLPAIDPSSEK